MAKIDDLTQQVPDPRLRRELEAAVAELKKRTRFGLVYESHLPEMTALPGLPITVGAVVVRREKLSARHAYKVCALVDGLATLEPVGGGPEQCVPMSGLMALQRFGEPIYPGLEKVGAVTRGDQRGPEGTRGDQRGPEDSPRPHHAVINAENYHAAQLLLHLYEGQVDCLYLDPPYNTGARDWTYNNDYVDSNDTFRHSKWLSFMEKRLRLAKRLLRPDGVLIITIDEHEVHHLGVLLEELFPEAYRQMVTIVINQKGVAQGLLSRVEEYAFFCFNPGAHMEPAQDDLLSPERDEGQPISKRFSLPRWEWLLRGGANSQRKDRKDMFYPIYVDPEKKKIIKIGEPLPFEQQPDLSNVAGRTVAWPIRTDNTFGRWRVKPGTLRQLHEFGYVRLGGFDEARGTWTVLYLGEKARNELAKGVAKLAGRDEVTGEVRVEYVNAQLQKRAIKTVWHRGTHDAGTYGSSILRMLLGEGAVFAFPKSLYAVKDCLAAVTRNRPNALIIDFFAGSGTTLHATCLLNAEDGGQRRCILVTNNEVSDEQARALHAQGYYKGDPEFEKFGIFQRVTRPRCEAAVTGLRPDGTPVPGNYIGGRPIADGFAENVTFFQLNYLDPDRVDMGQQFAAIAPLLWLQSGGIGAWEADETARRKTGFSLPPGARYAVLFREGKFGAFCEALAARPDITHVYLVTNSEDAYTQMRAALPPHLVTRRLYRDYLRSFRLQEKSEAAQ